MIALGKRSYSNRFPATLLQQKESQRLYVSPDLKILHDHEPERQKRARTSAAGQGAVVIDQADHLVIGSGLAGLNASLHLAQHGRVLLLTKKRSSDSATAIAQGGIASVTDESDSFDEHVLDTLVAGAGLCDEVAVKNIIADGPKAIADLERWGVGFDRREGSYDLTREGGHSKRRILHTQDITGREIDRALRERVNHDQNIHQLDHHIAVDLITTAKLEYSESNRCLGAYVLDTRNGKIRCIRAKTTLLATGGAGKAYLYTSNPDVATGDGVAMAFRAGAKIANMEFFQFHPTCLYHLRAKSFLISETLRGEGGILRRGDGTPLMEGVHPLKDLAPRDIVARAIDAELKRSGDEHVVLDMTHEDPAYIVQRFPNIHTACLSLGIDMTTTPIPVVPAAHYLCGGVKTDLDGATTLEGLWAAGETAFTGLHGANRLASNSLLEAAVMSTRAAMSMTAYASQTSPLPEVPQWDPGDAVDPDEEVVVSHNWDEVRRTMWNYVGIVRSDKRLARAEARIRMLSEEIRQYYWDFKLTHNLVELRNLAAVARLIIASAQHRRESRGLHHNINTPESSDGWQRPTLLTRSAGDLQFHDDLNAGASHDETSC